MGDSHTQTCALDTAFTLILFSGKRFKNFFHELSAHTIAVIFHSKAQMSHITNVLFLSLCSQGNRTALRCVFYRIGKQIQENLINSHPVGNNDLRKASFASQLEVKFFHPHLRHHQGVYFLYKLCQSELCKVKRSLAAFYFTHIKHIINKVKEMISRRSNFLCILPYLIRIIGILAKQRRESQHGIHRCTDVMGYIGQEIALCLVCTLRYLKSLGKSLIHASFPRALRENNDEFLLTVNFSVVNRHKEP